MRIKTKLIYTSTFFVLKKKDIIKNYYVLFFFKVHLKVYLKFSKKKNIYGLIDIKTNLYIHL